MNADLKVSYPIVDAVKFFMAAVVVAIHTHPFGVGGSVAAVAFSTYSSIAVKYFFVASGFFLGMKLNRGGREENLATLKNWIVHFIRLYLVWTLIFLPFAIAGLVRDVNLTFAGACFSLLRGFLFVGENYLSWPLWYLLALIWAGGILWLLEKWKSPIWVFIMLATLLPLFGILLDRCGIDSSNVIVQNYFRFFKHTRNGLFVGFPYVTIGVLAAGWRNVAEGVKTSVGAAKYICLLSVITLAALLMMPFCSQLSVIAVIGIFLLSICHLSDKGMMWMRESSTIVYFTHMLFAGMIILCTSWNIDGLGMFIVVYASTLVLSAVLIKKARGYRLYKLLFR